MNNHEVYAIIEVGTSTIWAAYVDPMTDQTVFARTPDGSYFYPSCYYNDGSIELFGQAAIDQAAIGDPQCLVSNFKRELGTGKILLPDQGLTPVQIYAKTTRRVVDNFQKQISHTIVGMILSVPANFSDIKKRLVIEACEALDLKIIGVNSEPALAATAECEKDNPKDTEKIGVFDVGGGTFDVAIVEGNKRSLKVLITRGIPKCGGMDMTLAIRDLVKEKAKQQDNSLDLGNLDPHEQHDFDTKTEKMKQALSRVPKSELAFSFNGKRVIVSVTADEYHERIKPIIDPAIDLFMECVKDPAVGGSIDRAMLVGGPIRDPWIAERFADRTGMVGRTQVDPATAVVEGGALVAKDQKKINSNPKYVLPPLPRLQECHAHGFGVEVVIEKNKRVFSTIIKPGTPYTHQKVVKRFMADTNKVGAVCIRILSDTKGVGDGQPIDQYLEIQEWPLEGLPPEDKPTNRIQMTVETDSSGLIDIRVVDLVSGIEINGTFSKTDDGTLAQVTGQEV